MTTQSKIIRRIREVPIDGFPDYLIRENGDVISLKRNGYRFLRHKINNKSGYHQVCLCKNGKGYLYVHRLVALHFIPNPLGLTEVDHLDKNKNNNHVSNLRWTTRSNNEKNKSTSSSIQSKYPTVYWHKQCKKWGAYFRMNGRQKHLGLFIKEEDAFDAVIKLRLEIKAVSKIVRFIKHHR